MYTLCRLVARYCFIEFNDSSAARQALESLNSQPIPGTNGVCLFFPYLMHLVLYVAISVKKVQTKLGKSQGRQWVSFGCGAIYMYLDAACLCTCVHMCSHGHASFIGNQTTMCL